MINFITAVNPQWSLLQNVYGQVRPDFKDLNSVAAHALASLLCPSHLRPTLLPAQPHDITRTAGSNKHSRAPATPPPPNSAAMLSCMPTRLYRRLVLADVLSQVAYLTELCRKHVRAA